MPYLVAEFLSPQKCEECKTEFKPTRYGQHFCSKKCNQRNYHRKYMQGWRTRKHSRWLEIHRKSNRTYRETHPGANAQANRRWYAQERDYVIAFFGGKCQNPECAVPGGMRDRRTLQFDHKKGDGYLERGRAGYRLARKLYVMAHENPAQLRRDYQLLCANCNWAKRWTNGEYYRGRKLNAAPQTSRS